MNGERRKEKRMTISLNVRGFPKTYNALNFLKAGSATKTDIIRYAIKVGYPSRNMVIKTLGKWRPQLLTNMVLGYLDNQLKTIKYFQHLGLLRHNTINSRSLIHNIKML